MSTATPIPGIWMLFHGGWSRRVEVIRMAGDLWFLPASGWPQLVSTVPGATWAPVTEGGRS